MCKFKDVSVDIKTVNFKKYGYMTVILTDGRRIDAPLSMFPQIKDLSKKQLNECCVELDHFIYFPAINNELTIKDILKW